ncbi:hypothetical protein H2199_002759 [Coniosporium tulheliwenetii]|uniref:Uncharacterized protein n=1 Tax=Coniosporium tulheliwenetii TaxID=3383036 RepID=A0ACC2ZDB1_9PEZI|nr:hypothetical protein H2199_002759 [Cladosporium sp. JES 115]
MRPQSILLFTLPLLLHQVCSTNLSPTVPSVTIDAGVVIGTTTHLPSASAAVNKYLGIPFAAPPVRFTVPVKPEPWDAPLNATAWKSTCIQQFPRVSAELSDILETVFNGFATEESEDCLYLNVYAPAGPVPDSGRAVMFSIYGGNLQFGSAQQPIFDGAPFAAYEDVILVTINYRTNIFGFASAPELPLAERNLGFLDQRAALDWVARNIHAFGGDPAKVTIMGESAGAFSVDTLITTMPQNPPFRAAILQSGQYSFLTPGLVDSTPTWLTLTAILGCSDPVSNLTCVRSVSAENLTEITEANNLIFYPTSDNVTLLSHPAAARGRKPGPSGQNNLTEFLNQWFGAFPPKVMEAVRQAYPLQGRTENEVIAEIFGELFFLCPQSLHANATSDAGIPTWRYWFNATFPNLHLPGFNLGIYHGSELPLVFSTYFPYNVTAQQYALSNFMRQAWARFAKNPAEGPGWNAVGTGGSFVRAQEGWKGFGEAVLEREADDLHVGVLGAEGTAGVKVVRQSEIDARCGLFLPVYEALLAVKGIGGAEGGWESELGGNMEHKKN